MYIYLIFLAFVIIITCCLTRNHQNKNLRLIIPAIGIVVCVTASSFISYYRLDELNTITKITSVKLLTPIIIGADTTYIKYDTIKESDVVAQGTYCKIETWKHFIKNKKYDKMSIISITTLFKVNKDTIRFECGKNSYNIRPNVPIIIVKDANKLVEFTEKYQGDNWSSNLSLISKRTYNQLQLKQSTYDSLKSMNPKIVSLWQVKK